MRITTICQTYVSISQISEGQIKNFIGALDTAKGVLGLNLHDQNQLFVYQLQHPIYCKHSVGLSTSKWLVTLPPDRKRDTDSLEKSHRPARGHERESRRLGSFIHP